MAFFDIILSSQLDLNIVVKKHYHHLLSQLVVFS